MNSRSIFALCAMGILTCFVFSAGAQEVPLGRVTFTDVQADLSPQKFYRARLAL